MNADVAPELRRPTPGPEGETAVGRPSLTAAGLAVLWLGIALLALGMWNFDGGLIWLGLAALAVLGFGRWLAPRNLRGLRVSRERPARVFAGELFEWTMTVERESGSRWSSGLVAVEIRDLHLHRQKQGVWIAGLRPRGKAITRQRSRLLRRGRDIRCEFEAVSCFPWGLFETMAVGRYRDGDRDVLLVCPQPLTQPELDDECARARYESAFPHGVDPEPGEEFRGVREYRWGDPVKTVHWGATARAGRLMVREWDPPSPRPNRFGVLIHTLESGTGPKGARLIRRPESWEIALRLVAGMAARSRIEEIPLTVAAAIGRAGVEWFRVPERHGPGAIFEWTALAQRGGGTDETAVAEALRRLAEDCDHLFVISDVPLAAWEERLARLCPENVTLICLDSERATRPRRRARQRVAS